MKSINMGSIGKNLSLLVLIAVLPALAILLYTGVEQRFDSIEEAKEQVQLVTHTMAEVQIDIVRSARQILSTLAMLPEVKNIDIQECNEIFKAVLGQNPDFQNIALSNPRGEVLASGSGFTHSNLEDRMHFQKALETGKFTIGEYIVTRMGDEVSSIAFAYPVLDSRGNARAVLTTTITLARFSSFYDNLDLAEELFIAITDRQGVRLLYYPHRKETNPVGEPIQSEAWNACGQDREPGIFINKGSDGIPRIFAFRQVRFSSGSEPDFYMWAGIPESKILGPANAILARNLLIMLAVAASALLGSWVIGKKTLISPIRELVSVTERFARGDLEIPDKPAFTAGEIGRLTSAFHDMAMSLAIYQATLEQNEARFRLLLNSLNALVSATDMNTHEILFINEYGKKLLGDVTGKICWQAMQKGQKGPCPFCTNQHLLNDRGTPRGVYSWEFKNTLTGHWYSIQDRAIKWVDDRLVRLEIATDITDKKEAAAKIAEEKERLAVTLRSIGDGVITTDTQSRILLINRGAETITGWSADQAVGMPLTDVVDVVDTVTAQSEKNPVDTVLASGQIISLAGPRTLISKKGKKKSIAYTAAPILDKHGNVIGVVLVLRDVTEKLRTEKELLKIKKLESIGVLAGGMAHDYNNILTAILGNIQFSLMDSDLSDRTRNFLLQALKASGRAKYLTRQLLTFSKGGLPVKETVSLARVIRDSADFARQDSKTTCRYFLPDDLWPVDIDKGQMGQVIHNLILNARDAMPHGGTLEVSCRNVSSGSQDHPAFAAGQDLVAMSIKDTGVGITENLIDKIFDPYFTTKEQGSGLGLAISHSIVKRHGGKILVESTQGEGSTFTVYLTTPHLSTPSPSALTLDNKPSTGSDKVNPTAKKLRILIMDDEEMIRDIIGEMLNDLGHETLPAKNGEEALEIYKKAMEDNAPIDLVIMDLTIPGGMGGKEAVQKLLEIDPEAKAIVSSGYSNDPVMADCKAYGFCAALAKPSSFEDFKNLIDRLMEKNSS